MNYSKDLTDVIEVTRPDLDELVEVIRYSLKHNFQCVEVDIKPCPDLSESPFKMTSKGFGKDLVIAEVGGPANVYPVINKDKEFDVTEICTTCKSTDSFVFGPGSGPWRYLGHNSEMVADVNLKTFTCNSRVTVLDPMTDSHKLTTIACPKFSLMANLAISKADERQNMIHIKCSVRTGKLNFPETIRQGLGKQYGDKLVTMAGIFVIRDSKVKIHVMPDFPGCPFGSEEEVDKWLRYFDVDSPLVCTTVFHSHDSGYKLRLEHTHCFSEHGDSGHYWYDMTPDTVCYEAWLAVAEKVYRIDKI